MDTRLHQAIFKYQYNNKQEDNIDDYSVFIYPTLAFLNNSYNWSIRRNDAWRRGGKMWIKFLLTSFPLFTYRYSGLCGYGFTDSVVITTKPGTVDRIV